MAIDMIINDKPASIDADPYKPLLWALREDAKLTGTKFGCGIGVCGACAVHLDGEVMRSCTLSLSEVAGKSITTIEGLTSQSGSLSGLQQAWIETQVPQCGYCQSGMIMAATALLKSNPNPSDADVDAAMTNICRCGTYPRIRAAIRAVANI